MPRPKNPGAITPAERTRTWRASRKERGGRELNVSLSPENAIKAEALIVQGAAESLSQLVNRLIERAGCEPLGSPLAAFPRSGAPG